MNAKHPLICLLVFTALIGGVRAYLDAQRIPEPIVWVVISTLLSSVCVFAWYYYDSTALNYARSFWLNISMVFIALLAVPYYLLRSRPKGQKGRALLRFLGFSTLLILASAIGAIISSSLLAILQILGKP